MSIEEVESREVKWASRARCWLPGRGEWGTLYATRARAEAVAEAVRGELAWGEKHWTKPRPAWVVEVREITDRWPQDWPDGRQPAEEV